MAWEENPRICLHMQLIAILSRTEVLNTLLAYRLRLWHTGIIIEPTKVMPVHLPNAPRLRKNMT